jgi:hypothetical protein
MRNENFNDFESSGGSTVDGTVLSEGIRLTN